jgi:acetyl esterase/lipase
MQAMRVLRSRAAKFGVEPDRIGFMGFSAGGNVAMQVAYGADDAARPNFIAPIYATMRGIEPGPAPAGSGPAFVVAATDDGLGLAKDAVEIYECWRDARLPAELHMYARGGHGFGMRVQHLPSDTWLDRFLEWFDAAGLRTSPA